MALWQYQFYLVDVEFKVNKSDPFDVSTSNLITENVNVFLHDLSLVLPLSQHWNDESVLYGNLDETCFALDINRSQIDGIDVRLDLREINDIEIKNILDLISRYSLKIYDENHKLYLPNFVNLRKHVIKSKAFEFVKNPVAFFEKLE